MRGRVTVAWPSRWAMVVFAGLFLAGLTAAAAGVALTWVHRDQLYAPLIALATVAVAAGLIVAARVAARRSRYPRTRTVPAAAHVEEE